MTFGSLLESLLTASKTKKKELASHLGYDPSLVSKWVRGQALPSRSHYRVVVKQSARFFVRQAEMSGRVALLLRALPDHDENISDVLFLVETALFNAYQTARSLEENLQGISSDDMVFHAASLEKMIGIAADFLRRRSDEEARKTLRVHALLSPQMIQGALSYLHNDHNFEGNRLNFNLYQYAPASQLSLDKVSAFLEIATLLYRWNNNNVSFLSFDGGEDAASFIWIEGFCVITETKVYNSFLYTMYPEKIMDTDVLLGLRALVHKKRNYHAFSPAQTDTFENALDVCLQSDNLVVYNPYLNHHFMAFAPERVHKHMPPEDVALLQYMQRLHQHIITHPSLSAVFHTSKAEDLFFDHGLFFNGRYYDFQKEDFAAALTNLSLLEKGAEGERSYYLASDTIKNYATNHCWIIGDRSVLLLRLCQDEEIASAGMIFIEDPMVSALFCRLILAGPAARSMSLPPVHYYKFMEGILNERWQP